MAYGTIKVDNITFDNGGVDKLITVSGLFYSTSGALTVTGTISGGNVTAPTATFTTLTGTTTAGTTATFTSGSFTSLTGVTTTVTSGIFGLGSAAAPSIAISGYPNTGIYSPGADQLAISTSGTARLFVNGAGNVGIGTTSLVARLDVLTAAASTAIHATDGTNADLFLDFPSSTITRFVSEFGAGGQFVFANGTSKTERMRIDASGRLLVGTSSARSNFYNSTNSPQLQIEGNDNSTAALAIIQDFNANTIGAQLVLAKNNSTTIGTNVLVANGDTLGVVSFQGNDGSEFVEAATINALVDGTPGANDMPGRLVFSTTADGASSPTERMRIKNDGVVIIGPRTASTVHTVSWNGSTEGTSVFNVTDDGTNQGSAIFKLCSAAGENAANCAIQVKKNNANSRSINAGGTINASGADYAEYMMKDGDFDIAKGAVCGVTADGLLTLDYANAVNFVVKSTNPSYVGGDTWGSEDVVGKKPEDDDADALAQWEADLEAARQKVDRIAFAGQIPVNVMGATPGQYIVPVKAVDGGIEGVAKNEADLTLTEYMRAVGKVIAIEDDGRARIIVKVA